MTSFKSLSGFEQTFQITAMRDKALLRDWLHTIMRTHYWMTGSVLSKLLLKLGLTNWSFTFP